MIDLPLLVAALVVIALLIFVRTLRRIFFALLRVVIFVFGVAAAIAGVAIMMNNETPFEKPGAKQRMIRFLTVNSAAASKDGHGSVTCGAGPNGELKAEAAPTPAPISKEEQQVTKMIAAAKQGATSPPATPTPIVTPEPESDIYPELIRRSFAGLS